MIAPPGSQVDQKRGNTSGGGERIDVMIKNVIMEDLAGGGDIARHLQATYGMNRMAGRR